jgi:hypothetical protein
MYIKLNNVSIMNYVIHIIIIYYECIAIVLYQSCC